MSLKLFSAHVKIVIVHVAPFVLGFLAGMLSGRGLWLWVAVLTVAALLCAWRNHLILMRCSDHWVFNRLMYETTLEKLYDAYEKLEELDDGH